MISLSTHPPPAFDPPREMAGGLANAARTRARFSASTALEGRDGNALADEVGGGRNVDRERLAGGGAEKMGGGAGRGVGVVAREELADADADADEEADAAPAQGVVLTAALRGAGIPGTRFVASAGNGFEVTAGRLLEAEDVAARSTRSQTAVADSAPRRPDGRFVLLSARDDEADGAAETGTP